MKVRVIITLVIMSISSITYAQSTLLKNSEFEPEGIIASKIVKQLQIQLSAKVVPNCYSSIFYVKFELNENAKIQNIKVSANFTDSTVINIVKNAITDKEIEWDIEKCKKKNPSLNFLMPIHINIFKTDCQRKFKDEDKGKIMLDFTSTLKYQPILEGALNSLYSMVKERFVGMVLNPLVVNNGNPSH
jgi:hypothetical protein